MADEDKLEPVIQPLLPDGGGYVCYSAATESRVGVGATPEEARRMWEQGILEDLGNALVSKWRGRGYL